MLEGPEPSTCSIIAGLLRRGSTGQARQNEENSDRGAPKMQAIPDARQQSFEEIYGPPENFLEIEVGAAGRLIGDILCLI